MPDRSEKLRRLNEEADQYELPYISKSRVMQWVKNPEHFRLKYLEGIREPETDAMVRGSRIHESFEEFYLEGGLARNAGRLDRGVSALPEDRQLWADFTEPYITNFLKWETERWDTCGGNPSEYLPVGIEEEHWRDPLLGLDNEPEWMGIADAVLPAASIEDVESDSGVVIVDFKTGSVPDEQYRGDGIYTELEYYVMLFEDKYDVVGAGAYYPRADELLVQPASEQQREYIIESVGEMVRQTASYEGDTQFEAKEGPLCKWGLSDDEESGFYGVCSQCTWGVPAKNEETFRQMLKEGYSDWEIAEALGTDTNAVNYWKFKMGI
jgi:hypothetical protein